MKKTKKLIIVLVLLLCFLIFAHIFESKDTYYQNIADVIVSLYRSSNYDKKKVKKRDISVIEEYLSHLTHINEEVLLDDFIIRDKDNYVNKPNSKEIYMKNGSCYIKYEDLEFDKFKDIDHGPEPYKELICNKYSVIVYKSMLFDDYENIIVNPRYDYIYDRFVKDGNNRVYYYQSSYDGTYLKITLKIDKKLIKITSEFVNGDE